MYLDNCVPTIKFKIVLEDNYLLFLIIIALQSFENHIRYLQS